MHQEDSALVLFSGGQDSTTCLAWALQRYARVETIGFDYGQRHAIELTVRPGVLAAMRAMKPEWAARLWETLERAKREWPAGALVLPAHYSSGRERRADRTVAGVFGGLLRSNSALAMADREAFLAWAGRRVAART